MKKKSKNIVLWICKVCFVFAIAGCGAGTAGKASDTTPPTPPATLSASDVLGDNGGAIALSWTLSTSTDVTEQRVYRSLTSSGPYDLITTLANNTSTYTDSGLTNGTIYYYVVRAFDGTNESADSIEASVKPVDNTAPAAPATLTAEDVAGDNGGAIALSWTPSTSTDVTEQRVYRSLTSSGQYDLITTLANNTSTYTDSGLTNGTIYYYVVRAFDGTNESADSIEASVKPVDDTAPEVIFVRPINGAESASIDSKIIAVFSEEMDSTTITEATFTLINSDTNQFIVGKVEYAGTTAEFTPIGQLSPNTHYTATITSGARDKAGNPLSSNYAWTFTTISSLSLKKEITLHINEETHWDSEARGEIYVIKNNISVNAPLIIKPGTIIKLMPGVGIDVTSTGTIFAQGTETNPIIFTSYKDDFNGGDTNDDGNLTKAAPGDWDSIDLISTGAEANFVFCEFYYGGYGADATVDLNTHSATIENSTFSHNDGGTLSSIYGVIDAGDAAEGTVISDNTFYDNKIPMKISGNFSMDDVPNIFHDPAYPDLMKNDYNGIFVDADSSQGPITGNITWSETEVPFVIVQTMDIKIGGSLTLVDNVILKFMPGKGIDVYGTLKSEATPGNGIVFTSIKDDCHGGDTNNDGPSCDSNGDGDICNNNVDGDITKPATGDWNNINLRSRGSSFENNEFYYGGGGSYKYTIALNTYSATIENSTFACNDGGTLSSIYGVIDAGDAAEGTVIEGNIFYGNKIPMEISGNLNIDDSNVFHDLADSTEINVYNGIFVDADSSQGPITGNITWSETEVPFVIDQTMDIKTGGSLTLGDNVILKFMPGKGINVYGSLIDFSVPGVWFTSIKDDIHGGDTNGDEEITTPAEWDWSGIQNCSVSPCRWESWPNILYDSH